MWGSAANFECVQQMVIGADGSIYVSGPVAGARPADRTVTLDGNSGIDGDLFITKFNSNGTKDWTRLWGGIPYNNNFTFASLAQGMTTTLDGSILVVGSTTGPMDGEIFHSDEDDIFITQFNANGGKDWTRLFGSKNYEQGNGAFTAVDGSVYVTFRGRNPFASSDLDFGNLYEEQTFTGANDNFRNNPASNLFLSGLLKFNLGSHNVTFPAGSSSVNIVVDPTPDTLDEGNEALTISLLPGLGYSVATTSATGTITDGVAFTFQAIESGAIEINGVNIGVIATALTSNERATQMLTAINTQTATTGVTASLDTTTGGITLAVADGRNIEVSTLTSANISGSSIGIALNGTTSGNRTVTSILGANLLSSQSSISEIDISTAYGSQTAITILDVALNKLTKVFATIGAFQNRLSAAIQNLEATSNNLSASLSRILDTDYAIETTNLAKAQIIQQAAMVMLAQANQSKQSVLALLKT